MKGALLTPEQAGAYLGVAPKSLAAWRQSGLGPPFIKLGSGGKTSPVRYRREALEDYIDKRERRSTAGVPA